ncbi:hypothetical protein HBB16_09185 [Pseudonocardia sp. MCCB 268]|nr:hypothetical protein [Pseudonocardia cytotoxica]
MHPARVQRRIADRSRWLLASRHRRVAPAGAPPDPARRPARRAQAAGGRPVSEDRNCPGVSGPGT